MARGWMRSCLVAVRTLRLTAADMTLLKKRGLEAVSLLPFFFPDLFVLLFLRIRQLRTGERDTKKEEEGVSRMLGLEEGGKKERFELLMI